MTIRCIVLVNHKDRSIEQRAIHSRSPYFVKMRATNWQVAVGAHHKYAINQFKIMMTNDGLDPEDFDYVSFDWFEGVFLDSLFSGGGNNEILLIWEKVPVFDIREFGPASPFQDGYFLPKMMEECLEGGGPKEFQKILQTEEAENKNINLQKKLDNSFYNKKVVALHRLPKPSIN